RDQIVRRQAINFMSRIGGKRAKCSGRDDERRCFCDNESFRQSAPLTSLRDRDQSARFERSQMIVHLLAWNGQSRGQLGSRRWLLQSEEQAVPDGIEGSRYRQWFVDDMQAQHTAQSIIDKKISCRSPVCARIWRI